jgi:hypothetical protein
MLIEELLHAPQEGFWNDYCVTEILNCERSPYCKNFDCYFGLFDLLIPAYAAN